MALPSLLEGKLRLPLIGAPMFIVSGPELVIAQCNAGIVGSFPALNARPQEALIDWIRQIKEETAAHAEANPDDPVAPFAVNQIAHPSNSRLLADMEVCVKEQVPIIITSLNPPRDIVQAVHSYGGVVFHDVINIRHTRKAIEQGVDGIVLLLVARAHAAEPLLGALQGLQAAAVGRGAGGPGSVHGDAGLGGGPVSRGEARRPGRGRAPTRQPGLRDLPAPHPAAQAPQGALGGTDRAALPALPVRHRSE